MSENLSLPSARVPLVDASGLITKEWQRWITGMFKRVGGTQGLSNQELASSAEIQQGLMELLQRVAALEAQNRAMSQGMQMLALGQIEQMSSTPPQAVSPDTFARIKVLGDANLATDRGNVRVGTGVTGSTAKLQVQGDVEASGGARVRGAMQVDGEMSSGTYRVQGIKVVGARVTGVAAYSAYAGQIVSSAYVQTEAQATDDALKSLSAQVALINAAMRTHGLTGD